METVTRLDNEEKISESAAQIVMLRQFFFHRISPMTQSGDCGDSSIGRSPSNQATHVAEHDACHRRLPWRPCAVEATKKVTHVAKEEVDMMTCQLRDGDEMTSAV